MTAEQLAIEELSKMYGHQVTASYRLAQRCEDLVKAQEELLQRLDALEKENAELMVLLEEQTGGTNHE